MRRSFALPVRGKELGRAAERVAPVVLSIAALLLTAKFLLGVHEGIFGFDFRGTIWEAARAVVHGRSPYPVPDADQLRLKGNPAVYPPAIFLVASPLTSLPVGFAAAIWDVLMAACLAAALRLVGVRDWRVYAVVFCSFPFASNLVLGQINGLLALGAALTWRYRDRAAVAAAATAAVIAVKLFLWPLAFWLLVTGRGRAALGAVTGAAALVLGSWAVIGFAGLRDYPRLLVSLGDAFQARGYSPVATALRAGLPVDPARLLAPLAAAVLLLVTFRLARLGFAEDRAFAAAVAAGIFSSPIVWMHSMVILLVALGVVRRTFGAAWLVPLAFWVAQTEEPPVTRLIAGQCLLLVLITIAVRRPSAAPLRLARV